ncbi:MAG: hypothetical protein IJA69_02680 [Clostridia bacterium]|nr:hypothetical protein [Clostridia bacterium]
MEEKTEEVKKKNSFLQIISNVLFVVVMVILIIFLGYGMGSVANNEVPSFFGTSYVRILSNSMQDSGFYVGDVVMLKKVQISEIKEGDIIAYYKCNLSPGKIDNTTPIVDFKTGDKLEGKTDNMIIFHQVDSVSVDTQGNTWYRTFGTSNGSLDSWWTRGDYVIGVYNPSIFSGVIKFLSSTTGIILLVIVPSCIVLLLLLMNIIDLTDKMAKEKKKKQQELLDNIKLINKKDDVPENAEKQDDEEKQPQQAEIVEQTNDNNIINENSVEQKEEKEGQDTSKEDSPNEEKPAKKQPKPKKQKVAKEVVVEIENKQDGVSQNQQTEQVEVAQENAETQISEEENQKPRQPKRKPTKQEKDEIMKQVDELVEKAKKK